MSNETVSIIIPTFNNPEYLRQCLMSIVFNRSSESLFHIYVVNNGHPNSCDWITSQEFGNFITIITSGKNLGWEGGLKLGLQYCNAPYVMFCNDDVFLPYSERLWINKMLQNFINPKVGAVGPSSNTVMGLQNMLALTTRPVFSANYLIGFCMLLRRDVVDQVGGVDDTLPGGDDLDLSIRIRNAGYELVVDKNVFLYHYGFKTGERLHGDSSKQGGWNSYQMHENTNLALIRKHGFRKWCDVSVFATSNIGGPVSDPGNEIKILHKLLKIKGLKVLDIGCGATKTYKNSVGVDITPKGEKIPQLVGRDKSVADITADVSLPLPIPEKSFDVVIGRHILEHMINPLEALRYWTKPLKRHGKLVIVVPNEEIVPSIPLNPQHWHAFTPDSMKTLLDAVGGLKVLEQKQVNSWLSFITIAEKI